VVRFADCGSSRLCSADRASPPFASDEGVESGGLPVRVQSTLSTSANSRQRLKLPRPRQGHIGSRPRSPGEGYSALQEPDWPQALLVDLRWEARGTTPSQTPGTRTYPFYGEHQAGHPHAGPRSIALRRLDVTTNSRAELVQLLKHWTAEQQRRRQDAPPGIAQGQHVGQGLFS
jgi:hypothetical protein